MADWLQGIKDWWSAPQSGWVDGPPQYFQYRQTQTPGRIADLSQAVEGGAAGGLTTETTPAQDLSNMLKYGPKTDADTARGLIQLKALWDDRAKQAPQEHVIYVDPKHGQDSDIYAHEATHSLYDQMNLTPAQNKALGDAADEQGRYTPAYTRDHPENRATEAAAYILQLPSPSEASDAFIRQVTGANPAIGAQIDKLYAHRKAELTKMQRGKT